MIGIDAFDRPLLGAAVACVVLLTALAAARARPAALAWPALPELRLAGARELDLVRALATVLRAGAGLALALAIAGPVTLHPVPVEAGRGLDLVLVVDASGSMRALDVDQDGEPRTRLALAREVVARFARQRASDGDRVGLVVFGDEAITRTPLTGDGRWLDAAASQIEAGMLGESTALGDALALAVKRALGSNPSAGTADRSASPPAPRPARDHGGAEARDPGGAPPATPVAGRVVVLLTDGRNNAGRLAPATAAELARTHGVRVHAVGLGSAGATAMAPETSRAARVRVERHDLDAGALRAITGATGGRAFVVHSSRDLAAVYDEIDRLERIARTERPKPRRAPRPEPFLCAAGALLAAELLLARVLRRTIP